MFHKAYLELSFILGKNISQSSLLLVSKFQTYLMNFLRYVLTLRQVNKYPLNKTLVLEYTYYLDFFHFTSKLKTL